MPYCGGMHASMAPCMHACSQASILRGRHACMKVCKNAYMEASMQAWRQVCRQVCIHASLYSMAEKSPLLLFIGRDCIRILQNVKCGSSPYFQQFCRSGFGIHCLIRTHCAVVSQLRNTDLKLTSWWRVPNCVKDIFLMTRSSPLFSHNL